MSRFHFRFLLVAVALLTGTAVVAADGNDEVWGSDEDWGDDAWAEESPASGLQINGFVDAGVGYFLRDSNPTQEGESLAEVRLRLETNHYFGEVFGSLKVDFTGDAVTDDMDAAVREAFLNFAPLSSLDLRAGRQILTWGTGDLVFLNDLFPKDWRSFFSGRDQQYLKAPADAIRATWYQPLANLELVWVPEFESDNYITGERFSYFSPMVGAIVAAPPVVTARQPDGDEWAARVYQTVGNLEWAIYGYRGYFKQPEGFNPATAEAQFPSLSVGGASLRGTIGPGIGNMELARHRSDNDKNGINPFVPNSQWRFLLGYEQELITNLTLGLQYYLERISQYSALINQSSTPQFVPEQNRHTLTTRLTYRAMQDRLRWSFFAFWSPNEHDAYLIPSVNYRYSDNLSVQAGANLFYGEDDHTFLGQLQKNDNVYGRITYRF